MTRYYKVFVALLGISTMLGGGMVHYANAATQNNTCTCSASMSFSRPDVQFMNGVLTFIPRADFYFSSHGSGTAPGWTANMAYSGSSSYTSKTISVPSGVSFSGNKTVASGMCGSTYRLSGYQLGTVPLTGLTASLVGLKQQLDGVIGMNVSLTGCKNITQNKAFSFSLRPFGNVLLHGWTTVH